MKNKAAEAIRRYDMTVSGCTVIAGVSGGADSMALLNVLCELKDELEINVAACHINHNLRGEESDRDECFVSDFCQKNKIPLKIFSVDVSGTRSKHESVEESARRERYRCFEKLLEQDPAARLATAHTASDNEETVMLNILRGTGTKGLCGIPPVRGRIIRPLICCSRSETEEYCEKNNIPYITDSSNLSENYTRNRLRLKIIPLLKEINPSLTAGISRMTDAVRGDNEYLEKAAKNAVEMCSAENGYSVAGLKALDPAILSRAVSMILNESGIEPSSLRINGCVDIIRSGNGKINLCMNKFASAKKGIFRIQTIIQKYRKLPTEFSKKTHTKD